MDPLILPFGGKSPKIHPSAFIAPGCKIIGEVEIGANASVWYNCVIRADVNHCRIGAGTNHPDGSIHPCVSGKECAGRLTTVLGGAVVVGPIHSLESYGSAS